MVPFTVRPAARITPVGWIGAPTLAASTDPLAAAGRDPAPTSAPTPTAMPAATPLEEARKVRRLNRFMSTRR